MAHPLATHPSRIMSRWSTVKLREGLRIAFKLPRKFDERRLVEDLAILQRFPQTQLAPNHGRGRWEGLSLYSEDGRYDSLTCGSEPFAPTAALSSCRYLPEVLASLDAPKRSVRVLSLARGASVFEHHDPDSSFDRGTVRLHVPIITHPDADFFIGGRRVVMKPGELWYGDFSFPHRIRNRSPVERAHLVMDVELTDSIRALFPSGYADAAPIREIHRAVSCWTSARKSRIKALVSRTLG
jgi:hypothetical protein